MTWDRVTIVEQQLDTELLAAAPAAERLSPAAPLRPGGSLTAAAALALVEDQLASRQLDVAARELKKTNRSFYTIGSAGHEMNAVVAARLRADDPAFLHYRSGGFYCARAGQVPGSTPVRDVLAGLMALAEEPMAGGRHKVFGRPELAIIPQTSTVASHLPRAVGLAGYLGGAVPTA